MRNILLVLLLLAAPAAWAEAPQVSFVAAYPSLTAELGRDQSLYLYLRYRSDTPLRMRGRGYAGGQIVETGVRYNPAPAYPAGDGEALVWLSYFNPADLDEIRIEVSDADWRTLLILKLPVRVSWSAAVADASTLPEWAKRLNAEQQRPASAAPLTAEAEVFDWLIGAVLMLGVPGYFVLQFLLGLGYSGGWRLAALAPLVVTLPATAHALLALAAGSNIWPIVVILVAPLGFLYLSALAGLRLVIGAIR